MRKVSIQGKNRIFDDFFKIDEAVLQFEKFNGQMSPAVRRLNFERGDSVSALIYNASSKKLIFVNQFKYPTYEKGPGWITETVAGMVDQGETPEAAIRREILEEIGYTTSTLEHISTFYVSPGGSSERIILYYAEVKSANKVEKGGGTASENEDIATIEISVDDALKKCASGEFVDAKTILSIYWLRNRRLTTQSPA